jgi:hypothetical protein
MYMSFARCHFRAQKSPDFQGPSLPMALPLPPPPGRSEFTLVRLTGVIVNVGSDSSICVIVNVGVRLTGVIISVGVRLTGVIVNVGLRLTGVIVNVGSDSPMSLSTLGPTYWCQCQRGVRLTGVIVNVGSDSTLSLSTCSHHLNVESHSK